LSKLTSFFGKNLNKILIFSIVIFFKLIDDTIKFIENQCYKTATTLLNCEDLMVLAKGISAPIAK